jgi:hypothetical protein
LQTENFDSLKAREKKNLKSQKTFNEVTKARSYKLGEPDGSIVGTQMRRKEKNLR